MGDTFKIYFVKSDKYGENVPTVVEAYELLRKDEQDVQVEWLSQEDCMSFEINGKPRHKIFIFDTFDGPAFDQIQKFGCRIYGPQCLIANLQHGMDLPKDMKHPIFNLAMKGVKVCCTAVDKNVRNEIQRLVPLMSGKMATDLTGDCTHLIAGEVGSQKYMVAQANGKCVMTKEWVFKVWEMSQSRHLLGTDEMFLKYKCPIFYGLVVCLSGFSQAERHQMRGFVLKGGGKYSGDLKINECTLLILKEPNGAKYEAARKWKIRTVTDRWLFDCIDKGRYLDPKLYQFDKGVQTSTPERLSVAGPNISDVSAISVDSRESTFQQVNETDMLSSRISLQLNATGRIVEETRQESTLVNMETTVAPADIFLDGCRVYLSGVEPSMQEKLKKVITAGGGFRTSELENGVTHVIVGKHVESDVVAVNKLTERPFMIRSDWLMDCFHKNCHLDEKEYLVNIIDMEGQQDSVSNSKSFKEPGETSQAKNDASMLNVDEASSDLQMAALLSQYTAQGDEPSASDQTVFRKEVEAQETKDNSFKVNAPPEDEMTQDPNDVTDDWPSDQIGIFNNKVFIFLGLADEIQDELAMSIESKGGRVINLNHTRQIADIAIVPLNGYTVNVTVPDVLTVIWLEMCLESDSWIPVNHWLARPIEIPDHVPLKGCCMSVSGFPSTERSSIVHLLECLGAICENHFARRTTKTARACTHLICYSPEGSKFAAAKKWGIPAVGKEWLIACLTSGKKPPEEDFDIEFIWQENEEDDEDKTKSPALDSSIKSKPGEPQANSPTANNQTDGQEVPVAGDGDLMSLGHRTNTMEKSMSVTPCLEEPLEKVPSSSKENSQCSSETDLNPLREVNRFLKSPDAIATRFSPRTLRDEKGKGMNENESVCTGLQKTPANPRIRELAVQDANTSSSSTPQGLIKGGGETPGTFMQPGYRAKFDFTGMFSPYTPDEEKDLNKSTPLGEVFTRQIEKAARNAAKLKKEPTPCQSQPEYFGPLHGVVIAVAKKLGRNHVEYNSIIVELGGDYTWQYSDSATHFVFQGRPNDTNKEFRKAREDGKFIVSPHWLYMCKEQSCRVDESLFPHHFNPSQALTLVTDKETPLRNRRMKTRNKGETPLKTGNGRTPARKLPMLEIQAPSSKIPSPKMDSENRLRTDDENVNNACDEIAKCDESKTGERVETDHIGKGLTVDMPVVETTKKDVARNVSNQTSATTDEKIKDQEKEALSKTLETVLAEASSRSRKSSRKKGKRINLGGQRNSSSGNTPESTLTRSSATTWSTKEPSKDSNSLPEPSQSVQVMWDDPTERLEKEKLAHRLERVCDPSQNTDDYLAAMDFPQPDAVTIEDQNDHQPNSKANKETYRSPTPEAPSIAFPVARPAGSVMSPQPVELLSEESSDSRMGNFGNPQRKIPAFMMSGMQNQERVDYGALVEQLGGKMVDKQHFDSTCTHLVVAQPVRNEKYLSSVAAGNWVLHKSYFEACRKEGKLVKEENHEWGSDFTLSLMQNMTGQSFKLAAAAHKWRKKVSSMKKSNPSCRGAFHGWTVMLCLDRNKEQNFQRLLEAGGATVQILKPPFPQNVKASHAFLDLNKVMVPQEDLETLIGLNVHCLKAEYIAAYLTDDPIPDPSDFYPPDVVALKACLPNENRNRKRKATLDEDESTSNQAGKFSRS